MLSVARLFTDFREDVLDERMINLVSIIADQVRNRQELFDNEGMIMQALLNSGCHLQEADAAITLMQTLVQNEAEGFFTPKTSSTTLQVRAMNREERDRFTVEAFGFIAKLTHLGIISEDQREELLEKALLSYTGRIELDHIKNLVAFLLFVTSDEQRSDPAPLRRMKKTAWN
jgi:uncharacterized protein Smg (DUF494 family)